MQISQKFGTGNLHPSIPVPPSHKAGRSSSTQDAPSHGPPNFSLKLHCLEYIAMSQALRDVIPVMNLLQEMREWNFNVVCIEPYVYCKVFEDNAGALELARLPKLRPRTKHINVCYHHFCEHVQKGLINIFPINTKDQIADALTKALAQNDFQHHRCHMCSA